MSGIGLLTLAGAGVFVLGVIDLVLAWRQVRRLDEIAGMLELHAASLDMLADAVFDDDGDDPPDPDECEPPEADSGVVAVRGRAA